MSLFDPIPEGTLCTECKEHKATVRFANDNAMGWIHGGWTVICKCCQLAISVAHMEKVITSVHKLREELEEHTCE